MAAYKLGARKITKSANQTIDLVIFRARRIPTCRDAILWLTASVRLPNITIKAGSQACFYCVNIHSISSSKQRLFISVINKKVQFCSVSLNKIIIHLRRKYGNGLYYNGFCTCLEMDAGVMPQPT